jgi:glyoxylase-like metal-dependent hydrolase (beta-lactamase superfamily II)
MHDVETISLNNTEFEGQNNAYLLRNGSETTLIDTGVSRPRPRQALRQQLGGFGAIDNVLLTHWHPDHAGLAGDIQAESGATVYVHEADAPLVAQDETAMASFRERQLRWFDEWGIPADKRDELLERIAGDGALSGEPADIESFQDGERLAIGGVDLKVLPTPGHTAGHVCFGYETDDGREAFVGDAILPVYTPNVGGADVRVNRPLETYVATLRRIVDWDFDRVWPGHRDVIETPTERAATIIDHHHERAGRVVDALDEQGPADAWTVSNHLFGEVHGVHILHGPGEAYAHLDHLERTGVVAQTGNEYRIIDEYSRLDDLL